MNGKKWKIHTYTHILHYTYSNTYKKWKYILIVKSERKPHAYNSKIRKPRSQGNGNIKTIFYF